MCRCLAGSVLDTLSDTGAIGLLNVLVNSADSTVQCADCLAGDNRCHYRIRFDGYAECAAGKYGTDKQYNVQIAAGSVTDTLSDTGAISCTECVVGKYSTNSTVQCESIMAGSATDTLSDTGAISCTECVAL